MATRTYFLWMFALISLTAGIVYAVDPGALLGLVSGILRIVFVLLAAVVLVGSVALLFGPEEQ